MEALQIQPKLIQKGWLSPKCLTAKPYKTLMTSANSVQEMEDSPFNNKVLYYQHD